MHFLIKDWHHLRVWNIYVYKFTWMEAPPHAIKEVQTVLFHVTEAMFCRGLSDCHWLIIDDTYDDISSLQYDGHRLMITAILTGAVYCYSPLAAQLGFWCWVNSVTTHHQAEQSTLGGGHMQAVCHLHRTAGLRVDISQDNPGSCISQSGNLTFCWGMMIFSSKNPIQSKVRSCACHPRE